MDGHHTAPLATLAALAASQAAFRSRKARSFSGVFGGRLPLHVPADPRCALALLPVDDDDVAAAGAAAAAVAAAGFTFALKTFALPMVFLIGLVGDDEVMPVVELGLVDAAEVMPVVVAELVGLSTFILPGMRRRTFGRGGTGQKLSLLWRPPPPKVTDERPIAGQAGGGGTPSGCRAVLQ